ALHFSALPHLTLFQQINQKQHITHLIPPQHLPIHHHHQNNLKTDHKILLHQILTHFKKFQHHFKNPPQPPSLKNPTH
ncbi:hypothetical protein, partial [Staphylococcus aureus]|uniref:hypothetical protein n=1 Tax=Staphylococcus aureus TaxID=1280 RepID=UPI001C930C64